MPTRKEQSFSRPVYAAIAEGATTPDPGIADAIAMSSVTRNLMQWTGTLWRSVGPSYRTAVASSLSPKTFNTAVATDASGAVVINLPAGYFTSINYISPVVIRDTAAPALATFAMVRSYTTSAVTVQCFESKNTGVLLGGNIEGLEVATAAVVVMLLVIGV